MEQQFTKDVISKLKQKRRRQIWRRILSVMMCIVVFWTTYAMILPAITKETATFCGLDEHTHKNGCFDSVKELTCKLSEELGHTHGDSCYEARVICDRTAHAHSLQCYSDPNADTETETDWKATLPSYEYIARKNLVGIAQSQLGYTESVKNYKVNEQGGMNGYTRYGAWCGDAYVDWNAAFVAFCLYYSGIDYTYDTDYSVWVEALKAESRYGTPFEHVPRAGDVVFFDRDGNGTVDRAGIIEAVDGIKFTTVEGDCSGRVAEKNYDMFEESIAGYGIVEVYRTTGNTGSDKDKPSKENTESEGANAWAELIPPDTEVNDAYGEEPQISSPQSSGATNSASGAGQSGATYAQTRAATLDLTPYIDAVTMYDEDGNPIASGSTVTEGDLIEFKIEYTIDGQQLAVMNGTDLTVISDTLTYKIPEIFRMIQSGSGNVINSAGQTVGTFVIDSTTGVITLKFAEDYVRQNAKGIQIQGHVSFFSLVTKVTDSDSENQDFEFTDNITLGVVIEEKNEAVGDLSIEKEIASVSGGEITYAITVTSKEGTSGPITITDRMSKGLTFKEGIDVRKNNTKLNNVSFNPSSDKSSFTMTLPEMKAGERYVISYKCTADIALLDADMTVTNTATVNGKDSHGVDLEDKTTVDHHFDVLKKTGVRNDDGSVSWTITINSAKLNISGWTLEDIITINNTSSAYSGTVTIKNSSGNVVANNVRLPYTFPNGSTDTYTVTYTTNNDLAYGERIVNKAILKDNNTEITVVKDMGVGELPFEKTGEAGEVIQDQDGNYLLPITWTVTVDTLGGAISGGAGLIDTMEGYPSDDMYMTYDQLMAAYASIDAAVRRITGQGLAGFTAWEYRASYGSGEAYSLSDLQSNRNGAQSKKYDRFSATLGRAGIPKGNVITFTYEAYGIFPNNVVSTTWYVNRFGLGEQYEVQGRVDFSTAKVKASKYAIKYYDPVKHAGQGWFWGEIDWGGEGSPARLEYEQLHDGYLAWAIELSVSLEHKGKENVIIYEDLPEGVSVRGLSLVFNSDVPTTKLEITEMAVGETYSMPFTLYPADQYGSWNPTGAQEVAITVKVTEEGDLEITVPGVIFETMSEYAVLQNSWAPPESQIIEWFAYLNIFTQIKDDYEWTPYGNEAYVYLDNFQNKFTVETENGVIMDIGSQTQRITKDERDGMIRKEAYVDNNNIITYSVVLNAYKKDLIENSGILAVHDELSYPSTEAQPLRLRLVPGSVKLYEIRVSSGGSYTKLGEVDINYSYNETSSTRNGTTTWVHTIDLTVPDGKSLLLEYSYRATGGKNITHSVANTCSIRGVGEGSLDGDHKVEIEVKDATAQADTKGVMIYKVDASSNGIFLENARFNIYIWNKEKSAYIIVHHPDNGGTDFTTDANGMIVLDSTTMDEDQFAYNTAYYIVEVASPDGYYLGPEPYYFYIANSDTSRYPTCIPRDFKGDALSSGDIIYRDNVSETTRIRVEKYWKGYDGEFMTVTGDRLTSITLELWQMLEGDPDSAKLFGTYKMTPDENGNWSLVINGLPKAIKNSDGTKGTDYLYYIKEIGAGGFALESAENNDGINSGTIKLVNREQEGYDLPKTGGIGTQPYTTAGMMLTVIGITSLLCINKKRERRRRA